MGGQADASPEAGAIIPNAKDLLVQVLGSAPLSLLSCPMRPNWNSSGVNVGRRGAITRTSEGSPSPPLRRLWERIRGIDSSVLIKSEFKSRVDEILLRRATRAAEERQRKYAPDQARMQKLFYAVQVRTMAAMSEFDIPSDLVKYLTTATNDRRRRSLEMNGRPSRDQTKTIAQRKRPPEEDDEDANKLILPPINSRASSAMMGAIRPRAEPRMRKINSLLLIRQRSLGRLAQSQSSSAI